MSLILLLCLHQILDSKADLCSFCNELAKKLDIYYKAPPLPVDLRYTGDAVPRPARDETKTEQDTVAWTDGLGLQLPSTTVAEGRKVGQSE